MTYNGCLFLEKCIDFENDRICVCCVHYGDGRGTPLLVDNYKGEPIDWDNLFKIREHKIAEQKIHDIDSCKGCYHLDNYRFQGVRKLSDFHFSQYRLCNCRCIYCGKEHYDNGENYDVYPLVKDLIDKGYYEPGGEASFQGGEPTMMPHFEETVNLLHERGTYIKIHTSGVKYSNAIENTLKNESSRVIISLDSGCRETYKKIKGIDAFDIVCANIKKYNSASENENTSGVAVKYIILPGFNDNLDEIDKFFKFIVKNKIKTIVIDIENQYLVKNGSDKVSPHIYLIYDYLIYKCKKFNIQYILYCLIMDILKYHKAEPSWKLKYRFLYNNLVKKQYDPTKNVRYSKQLW